jgi:hypothetical protein
VTPSVKWPPKELFLVVVTIKPAKANSETDRITNAISTSINENPFGLLEHLKVLPPGNDFEVVDCKTHTNGFLNLKIEGKKKMV